MPVLSVTCGILLILVGVAGYVIGMSNERASVTALIPAFFGIAMLVLGLVANAAERLRKHVMHVAVLIALIGFIVPAARLLPRLSELSLSPATISQAAMAFICLIFVVFSIQSFAAARRSR